MKNFAAIFLIVFSLIVTACPSKSAMEKAFNASAKLSQVGTQAAIGTKDLFDAGVISFETKESIAKGLRKVQQKGAEFNTILSELKAKYGKNPPENELAFLDIFFNREIIAPFVQILIEIGALSKEKAQQVFLIVAGLKQIIYTIANVLGQFNGASASFNAVKSRGEFANV